MARKRRSARALGWGALFVAGVGAPSGRAFADEPPLAPDQAVVDFVVSPGVTLYARPAGGAGSYETICTAPCTARLAVGRYSFALARGGDAPREAETLTLRGNVKLSGTFVSRTDTRAAGLILLVGGVLLGSYLIGTAQKTVAQCPTCPPQDTTDPGQVELGILITAAGLAGGVTMLTRRDRPTVSIVPGVGQAPVKAEGASLPVWQGLTLRASF